MTRRHYLILIIMLTRVQYTILIYLYTRNVAYDADGLIIAAHPDDAELGMGGTILRMLEDGLCVGILISPMESLRH